MLKGSLRGQQEAQRAWALFYQPTDESWEGAPQCPRSLEWWQRCRNRGHFRDLKHLGFFFVSRYCEFGNHVSLGRKGKKSPVEGLFKNQRGLRFRSWVWHIVAMYLGIVTWPSKPCCCCFFYKRRNNSSHSMRLLWQLNQTTYTTLQFLHIGSPQWLFPSSC